MYFKKALCMLLVVALVAGGFFFLPGSSEKAVAFGWIDGLDVASNIASVISGGISIAKFFGMGDKSAEMLAKLDAIGKTLDRIEQTVDAIWNGINVLYGELEKTKLASVMAKAWAQTGAIDSNYQQLQAAYANAATKPADFDSQKAAFDKWYPTIPSPMDTAIQDFYNALVKVMPGADACALDMVTDAAIVNCNTNTHLQDFSARVESVNGVPIVAERPMYFAYNGAWTGGHTEAGEDTPGVRFFFAEGTTRPGFETYFCVANPGDTQAEVKLTYLKTDGTTASQAVSIAPHTRSTSKPSDVLGVADDASCDFSALVESTNGTPIVAERPTYFNYQGAWEGGTTDTGCSEPAGEFLFAEGTTRPGFDTYFCIMNPGASQADVRLTYMRGDGSTAEDAVSVAPHSRFTVKADDLLGSSDDPSSDFSTRVTSVNGVPIVVERPMYFTYMGEHPGGHCETGFTAAGQKFYLAEGTTRPGFDSYLSIMNPGTAAADVKVTYMKGDGTSTGQTLNVAPSSRSTVKVNDLLGSADGLSSDFSSIVESTNGVPILVERPMYFEYKVGIDGGSCEPGITSAALEFDFAEGCVRDGFDSYFCLQNPGTSEARVKITYLKGDGATQEQLVDVPAGSRVTVSVDQVYTAANDLMSVYAKYIESLFWGSYTYQAMAARMTCDALDRDKTLLTYNVDGQGYMTTRFLPRIAQPEVDKFLQCVERLVLSKAVIGPANLTDPGVDDPGYKLDDQTQNVLKEANRVASMALGQQDGLMGTVISTTVKGPVNVGVAGNTPVTSVDVIPYTVRKPDGLGVAARVYPDWSNPGSDGAVGSSGNFVVTRYNFPGVTSPGTYDVIDSEGRYAAAGQALCQARVEGTDYPDPGDPSKKVNVKYGYFFYAFGGTLGPGITSDLSVLSPELISDGGIAWVEPCQGYRYRHLVDSASSDYESNATATVSRSFTFTDTADRAAVIYAFLHMEMILRSYADYFHPSGANVRLRIYLHDMTNGKDTVIWESGMEGMSANKKDSRSIAVSAPTTLIAGHRYQLRVYSSSAVKATGRFAGSSCEALVRGIYLEMQ